MNNIEGSIFAKILMLHSPLKTSAFEYLLFSFVLCQGYGKTFNYFLCNIQNLDISYGLEEVQEAGPKYIMSRKTLVCHHGQRY